MPTLVDAFLLGWRLCRQTGQIAHMLNPKMTPHAIFGEMTMPSSNVVSGMLDTEYPPPQENRPSPEHPIG